MRVLLDDGLFAWGNKSGIGHHVVALGNHVSELLPGCAKTDYRRIQALPRYLRKPAFVATSNLPGRYDHFDVVHHLNTYVPYLGGLAKHVMTIYDFSVLRYPETVPFPWRHFNQGMLRKGIGRADALITISDSIRDELLDLFPAVDARWVFVCPPGLRSTMVRDGHPEEVIAGLGLTAYSYFLYVGDLTSRKNLDFLLRCFLDAKARRSLKAETQLVLVGKRAWGYEAIAPLLSQDLGVRVMGYLPDEAIASLYACAKGFVYPSLYEGFGIPLVEAMSMGTPVVASRIPTTIELHERHGRRFFLFDLGAMGDLRGILECLDASSERVAYGDLSRYQYGRIAGDHVKIYQSLMNAQAN